VLETVLRRRESNCKRHGRGQPNSSSAWHTGLSGGAPASVRCARLVCVNSPLSGFNDGVRIKIIGPSGGAPDCPVSHPRRTCRSREKDQRRTAKIHRTIRWCTGLSGEPTVASANGRPRNLRAMRGSSNGRQGASDCPVCTGQCPVRQRARSCNGRLCPIWKEIAHRTCYSSCPVRHSTEGKDGLPSLSSTAPSCLGAIKGTPRHMEEIPKHSLSILRLPHSASAHLIDCVSDLSSV
jgi:hypothetical protein